MKLLNQVAFVTGAYGGIGKASCLRLAKEGAHVVMIGRDAQKLEVAAQEVRSIADAQQKEVMTIVADVTKEAQLNQAAEQAYQKFGKINILVAVAGGGPRGDVRTPFYEGQEAYWRPTLEVNTVGMLLACQAVAKYMVAQKSGKIIIFSSSHGIIGSAANVAVYSAAKGANIAFTKALAKELGQFHINVNCVAPGLIESERHNLHTPETLETFKRQIWLGEIGKKDDIANMVAFLASAESDYITGQTLAVCGGMSLGW